MFKGLLHAAHLAMQIGQKTVGDCIISGVSERDR